MTSASFAPASPARSLVRMLALALLCGLLRAALPSYEIGTAQLSPLSVVLGVTVAAAVARGRWTVLAALAGVLAADLLMGEFGPRSVVDAVVLALQAMVAGWLLRHAADTQVQRLDDGQRLRRFVLVAAPLAALVGVIVNSLLDMPSALATPRNLAAAAIGRLVVDWAGIVVTVPVLLCWLGQPPEPWRPRRRMIAVPLVLLSAVMLLGVDQVARRDAGRLQSRFERDATTRQQRVSALLAGPQAAVQAMRGVLAVGGASLSPQQFDALAAPWLAGTPGLQRLGWAVRQPRAAGANAAPTAGSSAASADGDQIIVRHVRAQPVSAPVSASASAPASASTGSSASAPAGMPANAAASGSAGASASPSPNATLAAAVPDAPGSNLLAQPVLRDGVQKALTGSTAVVTPAYIGGTPGDPELRVMVLQAVPQADGALAGVLVFATVATEALLEAALPDADDALLRACVTELDDKALVQRLAGVPNCETELRAASARNHNGRVEFGDRRLALRITEPAAADGRMFTALWLLALPAAIGGAMLSTLLLALSGRLQRIEDRVRERTATLHAEVEERRHAQEAMADSERRFRAIFESVSVGVLLVDSGGRIAMVNPAFCTMTGYDAAELLARPLNDIRLPDVTADDGTAAALGGQQARRQRFLTQDGRILQVAANLRALRDADGRALGTIGVLQDLTDMLKLRDSEREHRQADAADRTKSDFLARLGSELRAPLAAITRFAQTLGSIDSPGPGTAPQEHALAQLRQSGWQLLEMVNDLQDLSRIESGQLRVHPDAVPLAELIQETAAACEGHAQDHEVSLRLVLSPAADAVMADAQRLRQVLTHLIVNGMRFNHRGGQVELRTRLQDDSVLIEVEDDGLGLSELQLERLFTPFDRLDREQLVPQGSGIGLVICRRLLALMHGELLVRSREGEGSTFSVRLPRAMAGHAAAVTTPAAFIAAPVSIGRVLCIMAPGSDTEALRDLLRQRPGIELVHADSAESGLVQARDADLVLLDLTLPGQPGLELLKALKADPRTRRTPVVVVAPRAQPLNIDDCIEAGAADFLTLPFDAAPTLRAIDAGLASI